MVQLAEILLQKCLMYSMYQLAPAFNCYTDSGGAPGMIHDGSDAP